MQIGIVSDTHDNVAATDRIVETLTERGVTTTIHCGDFVAPLMIPRFDGLELHGVLGNNDGEIAGLYDAFESLGNGSELHGRFADLKFDGTSVAVLHGESMEEVSAIAGSDEYDVVCYGHYHRQDHRQTGETTIVNPGAHFGTVPADHRTIAILDTETEEIAFESVG